jgi:hypothetical protein
MSSLMGTKAAAGGLAGMHRPDEMRPQIRRTLAVAVVLPRGRRFFPTESNSVSTETKQAQSLLGAAACFQQALSR